ncbi:MAG: T9SS type A sorting domain-containing protein [Saprospiraceae bacterium]
MRYFILYICLVWHLFPGISQKRYDIQFLFEGKTRELIVSVPTKTAPPNGFPVVFMLHGTSGEASTFYNAKGWRELGQEENFITIFPSALRWCFIEDGEVKNNSRFVCGNLLDSICPQEIPNLVDDINFFRKIVDVLQDTVKLDQEKIFLCGFSNGGGMAHKCSMDAGDLFRAIGACSGPLHPLDSLTPANRIPVLYMFGTKDNRYFSPNFPNEVPFGGDSVLVYHYKPLNRALICQGLTNKYIKTETATSKMYVFSECVVGQDCAPYVLVVNKGQEHQFPNGLNYPLDGPRIYWNFFNNPPKTTMATHIENQYNEDKVHLFPNPSFDKVTIEVALPEGEKWSFSILDIHGKMIYREATMKLPKTEILVGDFPKGIYQICVQHSSFFTAKKFIKR